MEIQLTCRRRAAPCVCHVHPRDWYMYRDQRDRSDEATVLTSARSPPLTHEMYGIEYHRADSLIRAHSPLHIHICCFPFFSLTFVKVPGVPVAVSNACPGTVTLLEVLDGKLWTSAREMAPTPGQSPGNAQRSILANLLRLNANGAVTPSPGCAHAPADGMPRLASRT